MNFTVWICCFTFIWSLGPEWVRGVRGKLEQWPSFKNKMPKKMLHLVTQIPNQNYVLMWNLSYFRLEKRLELSSLSWKLREAGWCHFINELELSIILTLLSSNELNIIRLYSLHPQKPPNLAFFFPLKTQKHYENWLIDQLCERKREHMKEAGN